MLIHLQCIYTFWLFHVVILSFLDVLQSFYIIFWYYPIDIVPSVSCCFLLVFYIAGNKYQTESKHRETFCGFFFWTRRHQTGQESTWGVLRGEHNPPGHARWVVPTSVASRIASSPYKFPKIKKPWSNLRSEVPLPQASVALKKQSGAHSVTLPEREIIIGCHLHHPGGHHDEERVVHPRGRGFVPVAMCLISLSCSWDGAILMYHRLC